MLQGSCGKSDQLYVDYFCKTMYVIRQGESKCLSSLLCSLIYVWWREL